MKLKISLLIWMITILLSFTSCLAYDNGDVTIVNHDYWCYDQKDGENYADFHEFPVEGKWISTEQYDINWVNATLYIGYDYKFVNEKSGSWYNSGTWTISFNKITFMGGNSVYTGVIWELAKDRLVIDYQGTGGYYKRVYYRRIY